MNTLTLKPEHFQILQFNKEIVDKWIAALRSDRWVQHTGSMTDPSIPNSACCLMVVEAECNDKTVQHFYYKSHTDKDSSYGLPSVSEHPLRLNIPNTTETLLPERLQANYSSSVHFYTADWNDKLKLSFEQIATLLETGSVTFG